MPQKVQNALCRDLGWRIINAIDQVSVVTAHALVAAAILNTPTKRFAVEDILQMVETYLSFLVSLKTRLADTLLLDPRRSCAQALENYVQRKIIEPAGGDKEGGYELPQYVLPTAKRLQLEYYKNNCLAHFVPAAFVSLAILEKDAFQFSAVDLHDRYRYLQDFFKYEFAFDTEKTAEHHVRKTVKSFIDEAILIPHATLPDTYQITSAGFRKLKLFASFLATYFESYLVVLNFIKKTPRAEINQKDRLKKIMALGKASFKKQEIELSESISKINYDNGLSFFTTHGVKGEENSEQIEAYEKIIRDFITLIRQ
jgi:glycerol-3-phosphate O-acyltransferase